MWNHYIYGGVYATSSQYISIVEYNLSQNDSSPTSTVNERIWLYINGGMYILWNLNFGNLKYSVGVIRALFGDTAAEYVVSVSLGNGSALVWIVGIITMSSKCSFA